LRSDRQCSWDNGRWKAAWNSEDVKDFIWAMVYTGLRISVTDMWRRKIGKVFELAGSFEEPPTPHRFRHTFARILLQRGVPVADAADLLGDDEKTVREHYARWVPGRQARLSRILQEAFDDKPKPKLVALPGGG
jgi:integrase